MRRPFLLFAFTAGLVAGCGEKLTPVSGTVTYDGTPVDGAAVVFTNETGSKMATGRTDDSGKFTLEYDNKPGIPPGTYKVMVTRTKIVEGQAPGDPAAGGKVDKAYLEKMKGDKVAKSADGAPPIYGKAKAEKVDIGDLPPIYSSPTSTPLSVQVPVSGPVELKLEKKK
ncbi:carboxypeptidase-like regulatory domain-containing protein [Urbifossiella limnaea]|uniref:Carboxypeptidase regulatory-like domain-containing protein n=1 Tax=Urbifossiella limnaea TaxID=2528023 RepID=A0A517XX76_9BACT|nr:carboxypeptidase-like regulatory domain-containing protein [Urbifossiella limnaea]QDU22098.1 hypothetical protein ETAA1_40730 [Urbifossiella limnaea]